MGHGSIKAVLTADIVNSTQMPASREKILLRELKKELSAYATLFYRGDSFQVFIKEPLKALRVALICRALAISMSEVDIVQSDVRISIGIGTVQLPVRMPDLARGEAFILSGRGLDEIQHTDQRLLIKCSNAIADIGFRAISDYLDNIYSQMTAKQAVVNLTLLKGQTPQDLIFKLKKSKSTIYQLISAGRWPEIERLLHQFEMLINQTAMIRFVIF